MNDQGMRPLLFFIWRFSVNDPTALLPTNSTSRILTCGPSFTTKVRFTSFGPPGNCLISGSTVANWKPFSASMSRTIFLTFRTVAWSMNESRRMVAFSSFSLSSIFEVSRCLAPS